MQSGPRSETDSTMHMWLPCGRRSFVVDTCVELDLDPRKYSPVVDSPIDSWCVVADKRQIAAADRVLCLPPGQVLQNSCDL